MKSVRFFNSFLLIAALFVPACAHVERKGTIEVPVEAPFMFFEKDKESQIAIKYAAVKLTKDKEEVNQEILEPGRFHKIEKNTLAVYFKAEIFNPLNKMVIIDLIRDNYEIINSQISGNSTSSIQFVDIPISKRGGLTTYAVFRDYEDPRKVYLTTHKLTLEIK